MLVSEAREKNEERTRIGKQSKGSQLQVRRMSIIACFLVVRSVEFSLSFFRLTVSRQTVMTYKPNIRGG